MPILDLIIAPDPIFKRRAVAVATVDDAIRRLADDMLETMYVHRGVGLGANMVGVLKRIAVVDIHANTHRSPLVLINPSLKWVSDDEVTRKEASLSFPGIEAEITRPNAIRVDYLDRDGSEQTLEASGWLATVIQHELEYLDGKTFLDNLSRIKRDRLLKKMQKAIRQGLACTDPHCGHDHH